MKLRSKKFAAICCAVPAFAASDGWTNVWLTSGRGAHEVALAPHSHVNAHQAIVHVTRCDPGSMWLRVFDHGSFDPVTDEYHCDANHAVYMTYTTGIASGRWLQLQGGADDATTEGYSSGTCDFG